MAAESNKFSAFHERAFRSIYSEVLLTAQHAPAARGRNVALRQRRARKTP